MGLNTIFSYVFWDQIQPNPDTWDFSGRNNIAEYFQIAQKVGLHIVLRAGPYVCGEHEWGGFPAWLSEVQDMVVRSDNAPFLKASKVYLDRLAIELEPALVTNGGPILMAQIENEYGSYGSNYTYKTALRDMFREAFGITLYTNDGGYEQDSAYFPNFQSLSMLSERAFSDKPAQICSDPFSYWVRYTLTYLEMILLLSVSSKRITDSETSPSYQWTDSWDSSRD